MSEPIIIIIGAGGCGLAAARRLAGGRKIVIGSRSHKSLETAKSSLEWEGHQAETIQVDVSDCDSVNNFAKQAASAGNIEVIVHTSAVSPVQVAGDVDKILKTNLLGTAYVIDAFLPFVNHGSSLIIISSIAAHMVNLGLTPVTPALEKHFATAPSSQLLSHEDLENTPIKDGHAAYTISKRANNLRVQGFVQFYGEKGARINSVSPCLIMTKMGWEEVKHSAHPEAMNWMRDCGGIKRHATPEDVAAAVAFLASREASFISGTDILLDGGSMAGMTWNPVPEWAALMKGAQAQRNGASS